MRQQYIEEIPIPNSLKDDNNINDNDIFKAFSFNDDEQCFILSYIKERFDEILSIT